jgi:hypothetical protein
VVNVPSEGIAVSPALKKIEYLGGEIDSSVADRARTMTMMMSRIVAALRLIDPATQPHINIPIPLYEL